MERKIGTRSGFSNNTAGCNCVGSGGSGWNARARPNAEYNSRSLPREFLANAARAAECIRTRLSRPCRRAGEGCRSSRRMRRQVSLIANDLALMIDIVFLVVVCPQRRRFLIAAALTAIVACRSALHARQGLVVFFRRSPLIPDWGAFFLNWCGYHMVWWGA